MWYLLAPMKHEIPSSSFTSGGTTGAAGVLPAEQLAEAHLLSADATMWAIVLAGGIGSRFWPLSTPERPKQLLRLVGEQPLLAQSIERLYPLIPPERVLVLTSADIAPAIRAAIPQVPEHNMLVEPRPLGTSAAVAWGASEIVRRAGPDTVSCALHADLAIAFPDAFRYSLRVAGGLAAHHDIVAAIGIKPRRIEPQFGHMVPGAALLEDYAPSEGGPSIADRFVEKPDVLHATELAAAGALWYSGVMVWRAGVLVNALREHTHEVAAALDVLEPNDPAEFFRRVRPISIERGLLERYPSLVIVPGEFGWDDVGTWASLKRARELDDHGNGAVGDAHFVDSTGNVVHAESASVALLGVDGLLVVTLDGITFVTTLDNAADLRGLLDRLPADVRMQHASPDAATRKPKPPL